MTTTTQPAAGDIIGQTFYVAVTVTRRVDLTRYQAHVKRASFLDGNEQAIEFTLMPFRVDQLLTAADVAAANEGRE